jgi:hypothetical protein
MLVHSHISIVPEKGNNGNDRNIRKQISTRRQLNIVTSDETQRISSCHRKDASEGTYRVAASASLPTIRTKQAPKDRSGTGSTMEDEEGHTCTLLKKRIHWLPLLIQLPHSFLDKH